MPGDPKLEPINAEIRGKFLELGLGIPEDKLPAIENLTAEVQSAGEEERIEKMVDVQRLVETIINESKGDYCELQIRGIATVARIYFEVGKYDQALEALDDATEYACNMGYGELEEKLASLSKAISGLLV